MILKILMILCAIELTEVFSVRVPDNPCPKVFSYHKDKKTQEKYANVLVPYDGSRKLDFNATVTYGGSRQNLKISVQLTTPISDIQKHTTLKYKVVFPVLNMLPKVTEVKYNNKVICKGKTDNLGNSTSTTVWGSRTTMLPKIESKSPTKT